MISYLVPHFSFGSEILMDQKNYELIHKVKNRDIEAFLKLTSKYHKIVYTIAYNQTNNSDSAKHLTYKVFIGAFRKVESIDSEYSLIQLLFSLTKEICIKTGKEPCNIVE